MKRTLCGLLALVLTTGCSSLRVTMDYSEAADFSQFQTFHFENTAGSLARMNPLAHQRIVNAIGRELEGHGFREVDSDPDVFVTYYASSREEVVVNTTHMGYHRSSHWRWGGGMTHSTTTVNTYTRGSLVIDMWDAKTDELVWRGTASDIISAHPERKAQTISRAIATMFLRYPPPSAR